MDGIEKHFKLVKYIIYRYFYNRLKYYEYDDLFQTGCIGLIKAMEIYDESKGKFTTVASSYISGYIRNWMKRDFPIDEDMEYLEEVIKDDFKVMDTIVKRDGSYKQVEDRILVENYLKLATPKQREYLIGAYIEDKSWTMLSKELDVPHSTVWATAQRGIERIHKKLNKKPRRG